MLGGADSEPDAEATVHHLDDAEPTIHYLKICNFLILNNIA
jgi:hypothetical protein